MYIYKIVRIIQKALPKFKVMFRKLFFITFKNLFTISYKNYFTRMTVPTVGTAPLFFGNKLCKI